MFAARNMTFARPAAGGGGFDPLSLSPALWLDAADDTFYDATTGGSLVTSGVFARWEDKSSNSKHATQATSANRFDRQLTTKNGLPTVVSTGSPRFMNSSHSLNGLDAVTVFLVNTASTLANYQSSLRWQAGGTYFISNYSTGAKLVATPDVGLSGVTSGVVAGEWNVYAMRRRRNVATEGLQTRRNGTLIAQATSVDATLASVTLGIGSAGGGENFTGSYAEIIVYNYALSIPEIEEVESYLNEKWAIY